MLGTLILKEIHETVINRRFLIATLLCLILIPLGIYVTLKDYEQRLSDYQSARQLYEERSDGQVRAQFNAEGYRPPSPLSIFAEGLGISLPNKAVTSRRGGVFRDRSSIEGIVKITSDAEARNPLSELFGKIDFMFNAGFVLSIFALIFTFAGITSEKEQGTLKLIISNSVPRWNILIAKIVGNFSVFIVPFIISFLIGLIMLNLSGVFPLNNPGILPAVIVILVVTVLFLLCMFTFGMLVSTLSQNSITSLITVLFIWVVFVLVIPKLSPMVAQVIHPVESKELLKNKIQNARSTIEDDLNAREEESFQLLLDRNGLTLDSFFGLNNSDPERQKQLQSEYDEEIAPVREEYSNRLADETNRLQRNYDNEMKVQENIAILLSRVSPISCFTYILTELAGTGLNEIRNFKQSAERFQEQVTRDVYDHYTYRQYGTNSRYSVGFHRNEDYDDSAKVPVPQLNDYQFLTVKDTFMNEWVDVLLLALYTILFFAASFAKFLRYDVR